MIQKTTAETPIEEIHRIRREISDRFGGDIAAIAEDADHRARMSGRPIWHGKAKNQPMQESGDGEVASNDDRASAHSTGAG